MNLQKLHLAPLFVAAEKYDDIVETLLDYYGEAKPEPPKDIPVQFNSVPEENTSDNADEHDAQTGALAK